MNDHTINDNTIYLEGSHKGWVINLVDQGLEIISPGCKKLKIEQENFNTITIIEPESTTNLTTETTPQKTKSTPKTTNSNQLLKFIAETEKSHFRTINDFGANPHALAIWNMIRTYAGLAELLLEDLPTWCPVCERYHIKPHIVKTPKTT